MSSEFISEYKFGSIIIENTTYKRDIILRNRDVKRNWRRKEGHYLDKDDLKEVIEFQPELLIIGTGYYNMMKVSSKLPKELNFEIISLPTKQAIEKYNQTLSENKKIAGVFHLTC